MHALGWSYTVNLPSTAQISPRSEVGEVSRSWLYFQWYACGYVLDSHSANLMLVEESRRFLLIDRVGPRKGFLWIDPHLPQPYLTL